MFPKGFLGKDCPKSKLFILFKCLFQIFFLLLLNAGCFQAMYSSAVFRLVAEGGRLDGHVISEQRTYSVIECAHLCLLQFPSCKSINYETRGIPLNQRNKCQLNNATKISRPDKLLKANTFDYSEPVKELENTTSPKQAYAKTCDHLYKSGATTSGIYTIDPDGLGSFDVKCDMSTDNGGWTVFQRREDGSVDFNLDWTQYKNGFGDLNGEFWLGLDKIHRLSAIGLDTLRIDLESFANEKRYAIYSQFMVASKVEEYKLTVQSFTGNALDSLAMQNGMKFTTKDNDNDQRNWENCAAHYKGGWWFNNCHESNLNGLYHIGQYLPGDGDGDGVVWVRWKGFQESLKITEMKVGPSSQ